MFALFVSLKQSAVEMHVYYICFVALCYEFKNLARLKLRKISNIDCHIYKM